MLPRAVPSFIAVATLLATPARAREPVRNFVSTGHRVVCDRIVDDFSRSKIGRFPAGWHTRDPDEMPFAKAHRLYVVERVDGRRAIHARYAQEAITIGRKIESWNLDDHPILEWEWKAMALPRGGNERDSDKNDSAAGVYAIWDVGFPFHVQGIKYAWSTTIELGGRYEKRLGYDQLLVVERGPSRVGKWSTVRVDVRAHREKFFDEHPPKPPDGVALLTDADATGSSAEAYYANFRLCRLASAG